LDVYSEKTVVYDQELFEKSYIPQLCQVWKVICDCREIKEKHGMRQLELFIEQIQDDKNSPFHNDSKRRKRLSTIPEQPAQPSNIYTTGLGGKIELDF
jgi:hypothetical protein